MNEPDLFMEENDELNTTSGSESESEEAVQSDVDMEDNIWSFLQRDTNASLCCS